MFKLLKTPKLIQEDLSKNPNLSHIFDHKNLHRDPLPSRIECLELLSRENLLHCLQSKSGFNDLKNELLFVQSWLEVDVRTDKANNIQRKELIEALTYDLEILNQTQVITEADIQKMSDENYPFALWHKWLLQRILQTRWSGAYLSTINWKKEIVIYFISQSQYIEKILSELNMWQMVLLGIVLDDLQ